MKRSLAFVFASLFLCLLAALFAYTAMSKILEYDRFVFQMSLVPFPLLVRLAPVIAWALPVLELVIALLLVFRRFRKLALWASVVLLLAFEGYIGGLMLSGLDLPCTCGGFVSALSWKGHLWFNAGFVGMGLFVLFYEYAGRPEARRRV